MQPLDLPLAPSRGIAAAGLEGSGRLVLQLLLPRIDLVRMNLVALRQTRHSRLLPQRFQGDLRLQPRINLPSRSFRHFSAPSDVTERPKSQLVNRSQIRGPFQLSAKAGPATAKASSAAKNNLAAMLSPP
jgi:hypothetical protein